MFRNSTLRSVALPLILAVTLLSNILPMPGCNSKKSLEVASEAAKDIGGGVRDVIKAVGQAYDQKLINLEQKDKLADLLIALSQGGQKGVAALAALEASGVSELSGDQASVLNALFNTEVIAPFLALITELAKLSPASSVAIQAALISVRTAILLFSSKIGRLNEIEQMILKQEAQHA